MTTDVEVEVAPPTARWRLGVSRFRHEMIRLGNAGQVPMGQAIRDGDRYAQAVDPMRQVTYTSLSLAQTLVSNGVVPMFPLPPVADPDDP